VESGGSIAQAVGLQNQGSVRHMNRLLRGIALRTSVTVCAWMCGLLLCGGAAHAEADLSQDAARRFVDLAMACVHQEYPNKISHALASDGDVLPPHKLTPAFFGCYDWHSAVHGHWLLARAAKLFPQAAFATPARTALAKSLTAENIAAEVAYLRTAGRTSFERPYGLAWLLQLAAELRHWYDPQARAWAQALQPLEAEAAARIKSWLPKLLYPIRVGEHSQTAFAFGVIWDWATLTDDRDMRGLLESKARSFYLADRGCPLTYEPSGEDFLSPCLAEADFMRRVLAPGEFATWLRTFLPQIPAKISPSDKSAWLTPGVVTDRSDPKLAHIDGLNLSRGWMLEGIASGLPQGDRRVDALSAAAKLHRAAALPAVTGEHYEGGHWLGTFALYLTSSAGLAKP
jgi:hypothetical protein